MKQNYRTKFCCSLIRGDYVLQAPRLRLACAKPDTVGASLWPNIKQIVRISTLLKELIILSIINGNANIYTLRNGEALLSPYRNLLTLQDLYKPQKTFISSTQHYYNPALQELEFKRGSTIIGLPYNTNLPHPTISCRLYYQSYLLATLRNTNRRLKLSN